MYRLYIKIVINLCSDIERRERDDRGVLPAARGGAAAAAALRRGDAGPAGGAARGRDRRRVRARALPPQRHLHQHMERLHVSTTPLLWYNVLDRNNYYDLGLNSLFLAYLRVYCSHYTLTKTKIMLFNLGSKLVNA